ncbi:MFS transporter, partial [Bacillus sp. D-CC]
IILICALVSLLFSERKALSKKKSGRVVEEV